MYVINLAIWSWPIFAIVFHTFLYKWITANIFFSTITWLSGDLIVAVYFTKQVSKSCVVNLNFASRNEPFWTWRAGEENIRKHNIRLMTYSDFDRYVFRVGFNSGSHTCDVIQSYGETICDNCFLGDELRYISTTGFQVRCVSDLIKIMRKLK